MKIKALKAISYAIAAAGLALSGVASVGCTMLFHLEEPKMPKSML